MAKTKVLITVMTYPSLSKKHLETVCTAGIKEDGTWIRLYPVPHRLLLSKYGKAPYHKWQWIEAALAKSSSDNRPESFRICDINSLKICHKEIVGKRGNKIDWDERRKLLLHPKMEIFENMDELLALTKQNKLSLAILKPQSVIAVECKRKEIDEKEVIAIKNQIESEKRQMSLFDSVKALEESFKLAEQIPYSFKYVFTSTDGKERKLTITDWELGVLYRKCRDKHGDIEACKKVQEKYMSIANKKDLYLILGTQYQWQQKNALDPYLIVGIFAPPKKDQLSFPGFE